MLTDHACTNDKRGILSQTRGPATDNAVSSLVQRTIKLSDDAKRSRYSGPSLNPTSDRVHQQDNLGQSHAGTYSLSAANSKPTRSGAFYLGRTAFRPTQLTHY